MAHLNFSELENRGLQTDVIYIIIDRYYGYYYHPREERTSNPIYLKECLNHQSTLSSIEKLGYYEADNFEDLVCQFGSNIDEKLTPWVIREEKHEDIISIKRLVKNNMAYIIKTMGDSWGWDKVSQFPEGMIEHLALSMVLDYMFKTEVEKIEGEIQELEHIYARKIQKVFRGQAVRNRYPAIWKFDW